MAAAPHSFGSTPPRHADAAIDPHVYEVALALRELAAESPDAFEHVYGQTLETIAHWHHLLVR